MTGDIGRIVAGRDGQAVKHHMKGGRDADPGQWSGTLILGPRHGVFGAGANGFCNRLYGAGRMVWRGRSISIQSGSSVSCIRVPKRAAEPARQSVTIGGIRPDTRSSRIRVTFTNNPPIKQAGSRQTPEGRRFARAGRAWRQPFPGTFRCHGPPARTHDERTGTRARHADHRRTESRRRHARHRDGRDPLYGEGFGLDSIDILEIALLISKKYGFELRSDNPDNQKILRRSVHWRRTSPRTARSDGVAPRARRTDVQMMTAGGRDRQTIRGRVDRGGTR